LLRIFQVVNILNDDAVAVEEDGAAVMSRIARVPLKSGPFVRVFTPPPGRRPAGPEVAANAVAVIPPASLGR